MNLILLRPIPPRRGAWVYNPDWAVAFQEGKVRHICFAAETKGSMSSPGLRQIEKTKVECARRFFAGVPGSLFYSV